MPIGDLEPMVRVPRRIKKRARLLAALVLVLLGTLKAYADYQQTSGERTQAVVNETIYGQINDLQRRTSNLESTKPEIQSERLKNLEEKVGNQQTLLWGILSAVIINLLTGTSQKLPFKLKRSTDDNNEG